jgi:hypothetical protein
LLQTFKELSNFYIYLFCLWIEYHTEKKTENCIIARSAWCKVSVIFRVIVLSPNTQPFKSKFIPYYLIISKHKYYVMEFMFHVLFCGACGLLYITNLFKRDTKSLQFFNQLFKNMLHEKLNDWKMTNKRHCIFLFLHDLFAICGFSQFPPHGWLCTCIVLYLGKSQCCWWLGRRVLSLRAPEFEWSNTDMTS